MITINQPTNIKLHFRGKEHTVHEMSTTDRGSIIRITLYHPNLWYSYNHFFNNGKDQFFQLTVPDEEGKIIIV